MSKALERIKRSADDFINASDVAEVLKCDPNDIRGQAKERPELLGFSVIVCGTRVKIPRLPFIEFMTKAPIKAICNKCNKEIKT